LPELAENLVDEGPGILVSVAICEAPQGQRSPATSMATSALTAYLLFLLSFIAKAQTSAGFNGASRPK
jgi:hypothetical protein